MKSTRHHTKARLLSKVSFRPSALPDSSTDYHVTIKQITLPYTGESRNGTFQSLQQQKKQNLLLFIKNVYA